MFATLHSLFAAASSGDLTALVAAHGYSLVYIGVVFLGEIMVLTGFVLATEHVLSFSVVFLLAVLGTCTADLFWFIVGTVARKQERRIIKSKRMPAVFARIERLVARLLASHPVITMTASKFILGGRLLTILYLTQKELPLRKFIFADVVAVVFFVTVLSGVSWVSGKGAEQIFSSHNLLLITGVAIAASFFFVWVLEKFFNKELDEKLVQKT